MTSRISKQCGGNGPALPVGAATEKQDACQPRPGQFTALELFRLGMDTMQIAEALSLNWGREISESMASDMVHNERCSELGLPNQCERRVVA